TQIDDIHNRYNEERDRLGEEIVKEGQSLQRRIESTKGQTLGVPLVFEAAGEMIADAGEFVNNDLLSRVQQAVTARLSEIQTEIEDRRQQELARLDTVADERSATAAEEIEVVQDERQTRISRARSMGMET